SARHPVDTACPAGAAVRWEAFQLLAPGIQPYTMPLAEQGQDLPVRRLPRRDHTVSWEAMGEDHPAVAIDLHQLDVTSDEGVAVTQALGVGRIAWQILLFPQEVALEVALGDAAAVVLRYQDAVAGQHVSLDGILQSLDPPALLAVTVHFADTAQAVPLHLNQK